VERPARAEDLDDRDAAVTLDVVDRGDRVDQLVEPRVDVRVRHALELAAAGDVDVAAVGDARHDELGHPPEQLLVVEDRAQAPRRFEQEREARLRRLERGPRLALALGGARLLGDVPRHVDDELDLAVGPRNGHRAPCQPPFLIRLAASDTDDGGGLAAGERPRGRQVGGGDGRAHGVGDLEELEPRLHRDRGELFDGVEAHRPCRCVVREHEPAVGCDRRDPLLDRAQDRRELLARLPQRLLRPRPLGHRREMVRDRPGEEHLALAPGVRLVVVEHELAEQAPAADERDEREGRDPLLADGALELGLEACGGHVLDEHRLRVLRARRPRRVPVGRGAIPLGEAAPGAEAEHAVVVGEQDRRASGAGRGQQRVERGRQHVVEPARSPDGVREAVDGVEVAQPRAQLLALAHVTRGPEHEAQVAVVAAHCAAVHLEPHVAAGGAAHADRDGLDVLAGGGPLPGRRRRSGVLGMDQLEHRDAHEHRRLPAERGPRRRRVQHPPLRIRERDEVVRPVGDEPPEGAAEPVLGVERDVLGSAAQFPPADWTTCSQESAVSAAHSASKSSGSRCDLRKQTYIVCRHRWIAAVPVERGHAGGAGGSTRGARRTGSRRAPRRCQEALP
jgi:hypothetical protein